MNSRSVSVLVALGVLCVAPGCGNSQSASGKERTAVSGSVSLTVPSGWSVQELPDNGGIELAANAADVTLTAPKGPRFVVTPAHSSRLGASAVQAASAAPALVGASPVVTKLSVDGRKAVAVEFNAGRSAPVRMRIVEVAVSRGVSYTIVLETPYGQWDNANLATLERIQASVHFSAG